MSENLPNYEFSLNKTELDSDFATLSITHNKNMDEIVKWIRGLSQMVEDSNSEGNSEIQNFNQLLMDNRVVFSVGSNLQEGDVLENKGLTLKRNNNPNGFDSGSSELKVESADGVNVNFMKKSVTVMDENNNHINPIIRTTENKISIFFTVGSILDSNENGTNIFVLIL